MNSNHIYGLVGPKGSGKDTLARIIRGIDPAFQILHFADELKRIAGVVFGLTEAQLHDPVQKELPLGRDIVMDDYIAELRAATGIQVMPRSVVANTPRLLLQVLGTEYVRWVQNDFWIQKLVKNTQALGQKVLIADCRFENEAVAIRSMGGEIIRVQRQADHTDSAFSQHASETEMLKIRADYVVENVEGQPAEMARQAGFILTGNTEPRLVNLTVIQGGQS